MGNTQRAVRRQWLGRTPPSVKLSRSVERQIRQKTGILLDLSLGGSQQPNSLWMNPRGDLRHDPRVLPFPLPDHCAHSAVVMHLLEFLQPEQYFAWWDELWRVMRTGGIVYASGPFGGDDSIGWLAEPMHRTRVVELSFGWLDPMMPIYQEHQAIGRTPPKPWRVLTASRSAGSVGLNYEAQLQTRAEVA